MSSRASTRDAFRTYCSHVEGLATSMDLPCQRHRSAGITKPVCFDTSWHAQFATFLAEPLAEHLVVAFAGGIKRGKSTCFNLFAGRRLSPTATGPCTKRSLVAAPSDLPLDELRRAFGGATVAETAKPELVACDPQAATSGVPTEGDAEVLAYRSDVRFLSIPNALLVDLPDMNGDDGDRITRSLTVAEAADLLIVVAAGHRDFFQGDIAKFVRSHLARKRPLAIVFQQCDESSARKSVQALQSYYATKSPPEPLPVETPFFYVPDLAEDQLSKPDCSYVQQVQLDNGSQFLSPDYLQRCKRERHLAGIDFYLRDYIHPLTAAELARDQDLSDLVRTAEAAVQSAAERLVRDRILTEVVASTLARALDERRSAYVKLMKALRISNWTTKGLKYLATTKGARAVVAGARALAARTPLAGFVKDSEPSPAIYDEIYTSIWNRGTSVLSLDRVGTPEAAHCWGGALRLFFETQAQRRTDRVQAMESQVADLIQKLSTGDSVITERDRSIVGEAAEAYINKNESWLRETVATVAENAAYAVAISVGAVGAPEAIAGVLFLSNAIWNSDYLDEGFRASFEMRLRDVTVEFVQKVYGVDDLRSVAKKSRQSRESWERFQLECESLRSAWAQSIDVVKVGVA